MLDRPSLPPKAEPVALRRKSVRDAGMQEENHEWLPYLNKRRAREAMCRTRPEVDPGRCAHGVRASATADARSCQRVCEGGRWRLALETRR